MFSTLLLLLEQGPAQTTNYFIAGYVVIFGVMFLYVLSLFIRKRNLIQDLELMQSMEE